MAKGVIYYVTKDKDADVSFYAENYYDKLDALGTDYVKDQTTEESEEPLRQFERTLSHMGAMMGYGVDTFDHGFRFTFCFQDAGHMREKYFSPRLEQLKKEADALTLKDVISRPPVFSCLTGSSPSDFVTMEQPYGESDMDMDEFIRQIESEVTYYVFERVILMH